MNLSNDLIAQFVRATKDTRKVSTESTVYGTTLVDDGKVYVQLDGSNQLTPVSTTTDVQSGERVTVLIKDHTAIITGNISTPAARTDDVALMGSKITEVEILVADKVSIKELEAESGRIDDLISDNVVVKEKLEANEAFIDDLITDNVIINDSLIAQEAVIKRLETEKLDATYADITFATIENLDAINANIHNLEATYGNFQILTTSKLDATEADIGRLDAEKLNATEAELKYANIDFANISEAAVEKIFADSGIIKDIVVSDGTITGELVGVTIKGDLIEANTLKADKLVVKGSDGLYYKLNIEAGAVESSEVSKEELQNGLHGTAIIAKTITAEKIAVDDLVAFDATIGGFNITNDALYSGVKNSADNTTRGIYLDNQGQLSVGDSTNFLRYFKVEDGTYKLEIAASSLIFAASGKGIEETISDGLDNIQVGARNLIRNSTNLIFSDYFFASATSDSAVLGTAILGLMVLDDGNTLYAARLNQIESDIVALEQELDNVKQDIVDEILEGY